MEGPASAGGGVDAPAVTPLNVAPANAALTSDESWIGQLAGISLSRQEVDDMWSVFDENGDGIMDVRELRIAIQVRW
jgi:hypothetical protein